MTTETETPFVDGWISDDRGNKCSVAYFGSEEAARKALASLEDCDDCIDCSGCSRCSRCLDCSRCSGCSGCSDCSGCSGCSDCSRCSRCSNIARLWDKKGLRGDPDAAPGQPPGAPPIPVIENIHAKVLAAATETDKSLNMIDWHICNTTHCRAGWVVHLAGEAGYALERFHNTPLAAQLIYAASSPHKVSPPRFYETNEQALADMERLAQLEMRNDNG